MTSLAPALPVTANSPLSFLAWLWQKRLILLAILVIGGLALALRLATYERYLPFVDYTDEAVYVALGQEIRGLSDESALREKYGSLPPLYWYINALVQTGYDQIKPHSWTLISDYYYALRFVAVIMGVMTALGMMWLGWQIGGPIAGLVAGFIWAAHPTIVELNSLAIPDPPLYLCVVLAVCAGLYAWKYNSKWALFWALIAGIIGTYLKYWVVTVTFPFIVAWFVLFRRNPRILLPWTIVYGLIAVSAASFLLFGINPFQTNNTLNKYETTSLLGRMFDLQRLTNNFWHAAYPVSVPLYVGGLIVGGLAFLYSRSRKRALVDSRFVGLLLVMSIVGFFLTTAISNVDLSDAGRMRHILPTMTVMFVLWGTAVAQFIWTVRDELATRPILEGISWVVPAVATGALLLILAMVYLPTNSETIKRFSKEHVVNQIRNWADVAIPNEGLVLQPFQSDLDRIWNRMWGAYAGDNPLLYWSEKQTQILAAKPQDYADRNIDYLVISEYDLTAGQYTDPAIRTWLKQLYLLKTFPQSADVVGTTAYFYKMLPPQKPSDAVFGGIVALDGYDLSTTTLVPGEILRLRPYWRIQQVPPTNYSIFVHLYPADSQEMKAQQDGALVDRNRQTQQWTDINEVYIGRETALSIPADLPPGDYRLAVGVYDYTTFQRLLLADGTDFYAIPITIK